MKRLLFAPILLGLISPFVSIADELDYRCLEYGKRNCAVKMISKGMCSKMHYMNKGDDLEKANQKAYYDYIVLSKLTGYLPTEEDRKLKKDESILLLVKALILAECPDVFVPYAAKTYGEKPLGDTWDKHQEMSFFFEYFNFSLYVGMSEILMPNEHNQPKQ